MITAAQIAGLRTASIDYEETKRLKAKLARLRQERQPLYLTHGELEEILRWKLRGQIARGAHLREANTDQLIRAITAAALNASHPDKEHELELRVRILCRLPGVSVPVASAILALIFPDDYAIVDFRVWRQVFGKEKRTFSLTDYKRYMEAIKPLAKELAWQVQEVDLAVWEYDRRAGGWGQRDTGRNGATGGRAENPSVPVHELVDKAGRALQAASGGEPFTQADFQREIVRLGGGRFARGSILPSDFCYNRINRYLGSCTHPVFEHVERGRYRYLGLGYPFSGPIFWKEKKGQEKKVGEWVSGRCMLREDPRKPGSDVT